MATLVQQIITEFGVNPDIDVAAEVEKRIIFLANYLRSTGQKTYVLGISGGVDSTVAGRLAQLAVERLRTEGYDAMFIAVRLPYGVQRDEADAQAALAFINPDQVLTVDIKPASDAMMDNTYFAEDDPIKMDFILGNIKARQRMISQYAIAGAASGLVIGTDHAAESLMGFFTKFGDGACDLTPLARLNKRQVRQIAEFLGASNALVYKIPMAGLEDLDPDKSDEASYGVTYDQIDDFLEGKTISVDAEVTIVNQYLKTMHKRALPMVP